MARKGTFKIQLLSALPSPADAPAETPAAQHRSGAAEKPLGLRCAPGNDACSTTGIALKGSSSGQDSELRF